MSWQPYLRSIFSEAARAVLPICLLLIILKAIFLGLTAASSDAFLLGMRGTLLLSAGVLLIVFGLSFFLQGLEHSLLPLGRTVGSTLPQPARLWSIMLFALVLGALATIAEPDLIEVRNIMNINNTYELTYDISGGQNDRLESQRRASETLPPHR